MGNDLLLCFGEVDEAFEMWRISDQVPVRVWRHESGSGLNDVSKDHKWLACCNSKEVLVLGIEDGKIESRMPARQFSREGNVAFHPYLPFISLSSYFSNALEIRNWRTQETLASIGPENFKSPPGNWVSSTWSPNGDQLVFAANSLFRFKFDSENFSFREVPYAVSTTTSIAGSTIRVSASGDRLLLNGWDYCLRIFDALEGNRIAVSPHGKWKTLPLLPMKRDPLGKYAGFVGSMDCARDIGLMEVADGRECHLVMSGETGPMAIDSTGRLLVTVTKSGISVLDVRQNRGIGTRAIEDLDAYAICFDHVGHFYTTCSQGCFRWPLTHSQTILIGIPERINAPIGNSIALASSGDGKIGPKLDKH